MTKTDSATADDQPAGAAEQARRGLEQAAAGDRRGATRVARAERQDATAEHAAEQEAADGPGGRGLSR